MDEVGIDISKQTSNSLYEYKDQEFDYVVIICGNDYNACSFFFGGKKLFLECLTDIYPFKGTISEKIELLREIRDEIGDWVQDFFNYKIDYIDPEESSEEECCEDPTIECCTTDSIKDNES